MCRNGLLYEDHSNTTAVTTKSSPATISNTTTGLSAGLSTTTNVQGAASSSVEPDENGYPETLTMGHLETAVRILAMLARGGGCSTFEERLDLLLQAYYFLGRMASMVAETVACGHRYRLYEEAVPEGPDRSKTPFEEWWNASGESGKILPHLSSRMLIYQAHV